MPLPTRREVHALELSMHRPAHGHRHQLELLQEALIQQTNCIRQALRLNEEVRAAFQRPQLRRRYPAQNVF